MNKKIVSIIGITVLLALIFTDQASAQRRKKKKKEEPKVVSIYDVDTLVHPIPRNRQLFHDKIDKEQRRADASDGTVDGVIYYSEDTVYTGVLTKAILTDVDHIQIMIENLPPDGRDGQTDNQRKIRYLKAVWEMLMKYNRDVKVDPFYYKRLVNNMHDMIIADEENNMQGFVDSNINIYTLNNSIVMLEDKPDEKALIYQGMGKKDPKLMIKRLTEFADQPFACDIIADAARVTPSEVFNYASSTDFKLRNAVRNCSDPLVQTIVSIADKSRAPLKVMPFLSNIYNKKMTIEEVDKLADDPELYFKALVNLKLEHDTLGSFTYSDELAYRALTYVREMDDLHESPDPVRFKCLEKLSAPDLYFIMVDGQDEIYTSSFLGTFKRMLEKMKPMTGRELLDTVYYDHFRTFIRMCAGFNTLSEFLGTMSEDNKTQLMTKFIAGLEKGKEDDLEDAVDVADAFGSIKDSSLADFLELQVKKNYELSFKENSRKGVIVYGLLATLFHGSKGLNNDEAAAQQSAVLKLPPINLVPYKSLLGDTDVVFEQVFFFGDEDGKNSFASFLTNFKEPGKWKITYDKYWAVIASTKGKPIIIYANLPIPEPDDEDAQNRLCKYLDDNNIHPTIVIHRGHSYHLPLTLDKLAKQDKIVILGSCGGYHNLSIVLDHSPDAHIISSKQTGTMSVNEPIIKAIEDQLLEGHDKNWMSIWKDLDTYFAKKPDLQDKFSDYVPPYRNLGAIFIKAYRRILNDEDQM